MANDLKPLGRLEQVDLREHFRREDTEFTPWLASPENLKLLGDALGLSLEIVGQETDVGPFRADIVAMNTDDETTVLIENQLERTDHGHLGQLITYAAGLDAVDIVWVVRSFSDAHRAALDWLNRITEERFRFFGVEVELWKIGDSPAAPRFNVVARPNDWAKEAKEDVQRLRDAGPNKRLQHEYWSALLDLAEKERIPLGRRKIRTGHHQPFGTGIRGAGLRARASCSQGDIGVGFRFDERHLPGVYDSLLARRTEIEKELGFAMEWEGSGSRLRPVTLRRNADLENRGGWSEYHRWTLDHLVRLVTVFMPRIKLLARDIEMGDADEAGAD